MADVVPLRALTYDATRVVLDRVIAPPYDVIDDEARASLAVDPHAFVHLDLPRPPVEDPAADPYATAAARLRRWVDDGIMRASERPAIYRYHQRFVDPDGGGQMITRRGFLAGVRLTPWSERVVRPHERTLGAPVADRLRLLRATSVHLSPVFTAFRDPAGEVERLLHGTDRGPPLLEARTADGTEHRIWACTDAELHGRLRHALASTPLYVLDGHHRYETMLAYQAEQAAAAPVAPHAAVNYGLAFLVPLDDAGLIVRPTHRLVHGLEGLDVARVLAAAAPWFDVDRVDGGAEAACLRQRDVGAHTSCFVALGPDPSVAHLLTLRSTVDPAALGGDVHSAVARLDVSVLHALLFERGLGLTAAQISAQAHLRYAHTVAEVQRDLASGAAQVGLLVRPTTIEQVCRVADLGERMPQKSTFFFPKLASGLVLASAGRDDDLL